MRYGDERFISEPIGNFIGIFNLEKSEDESIFEKIFNKTKQITGFDEANRIDERKAVNSRDIKLNYLHSKVQRKNSEFNEKEL